MNLHKLGLLALILMVVDAVVLVGYAIANPYLKRTMHYWSGGGEPYYAIHPLIVACTVLLPVLAAAWLLCGTKRSALDWAFLIAACIATAGVWVWRYPPPPFLG